MAGGGQFDPAHIRNQPRRERDVRRDNAYPYESPSRGQLKRDSQVFNASEFRFNSEARGKSLWIRSPTRRVETSPGSVPRKTTPLHAPIRERRALDQVLVGEAVSAIVGHDRRPAGVRSAHFWGKRVELQCEQAEPADVRRPSPKMANQVFLEFVTGNLIAQMRESSK